MLLVFFCKRQCIKHIFIVITRNLVNPDDTVLETTSRINESGKVRLWIKEVRTIEALPWTLHVLRQSKPIWIWINAKSHDVLIIFLCIYLWRHVRVLTIWKDHLNHYVNLWIIWFRCIQNCDNKDITQMKSYYFPNFWSLLYLFEVFLPYLIFLLAPNGSSSSL